MSSAAVRCSSLCAWALAFMAASPARAEPEQDEVVLSGDQIGDDAFGVFRSAFARDGTRLRRGGPLAGCTGTLSDGGVRARVTIEWNGGALVEMCFQDRCRSVQRTLGPFSKLDARAREEVITVVELGLAALSCAVPEAPAVATAPTTPVAAHTTRPEVSSPHAAGAARETTEGVRTAAAIPVSEVEAPREPEAAESAGAPDSQVDTASAADSGSDDNSAGRHLFALMAGYALTRWTDSVFAHSVSGTVAYAVHALPLYVGLELGYAPHFRALDQGLGLEGSCVRLALELWARWTFGERWALDAQLGPAVEWLSLQPAASTAQTLVGSTSTTHGDPLLFARLGPALRVYGPLSVGLALQVDASLIQRSFGFTSGITPQVTFAPDQVRLSLALNAHAEL